MSQEERQKFKGFYKLFSILWLIFLLTFVLVNFYSTNLDIKSEILNGILLIILQLGIFGIPIIFVFSVLIRFVEVLINKIVATRNKTNLRKED
ncbi:MAG: hypothetical protein BalsKO_25410 [Balneolaceae bacterium]